MKLVRILVYEGSEKFIKENMGTRQLVGRKQMMSNSITEYFIQEPLPVLTDCPIDFEPKESREKDDR